MEFIYLQALAGHLVYKLQENRRERLSGDAGQSTLEASLIIGALAAIALTAAAIFAAKVLFRAHGIDGGDAPTPTTYGP